MEHVVDVSELALDLSLALSQLLLIVQVQEVLDEQLHILAQLELQLFARWLLLQVGLVQRLLIAGGLLRKLSGWIQRLTLRQFGRRRVHQISFALDLTVSLEDSRLRLRRAVSDGCQLALRLHLLLDRHLFVFRLFQGVALLVQSRARAGIPFAAFV